MDTFSPTEPSGPCETISRMAQTPAQVPATLSSGSSLPVLLPAGADSLPADVAELVAEAIRAGKSERTKRAYLSDWNRFAGWCHSQNACPLPATPSCVGAYLTTHAKVLDETGRRSFAIATLKRWLSTINYIHGAMGLPKPGDDQQLKDTVKGLVRLYTRDNPRRPNKRAALLLEPLRDIVTTARTDATTWRTRVRERRDTALLLTGWAAAMRRSEITALTINDLASRTYHPPENHSANDGWLIDGLTVTVRLSKTDQTGEELIKILPSGTELASCAPCAIIRWLHVLATWETDGRIGLMREFDYRDRLLRHVCHGPEYGAHMALLDPALPLFRGITRSGLISADAPDPVMVHRVTRSRAEAAGWSPETVNKLGAHSLRAGFVTEGFERGATPHEIKQQTGHTSDTVLAGYARHVTAWDSNAANRIGM